jgi:hypothetical protein
MKKIRSRSRSRSNKRKTVRSRSRSRSRSNKRKTVRSRSRSRSRSNTRKTVRSRSRSKSLTCSQMLRRKVAINIKEGTYSSTAQAVAVAYSQVRKQRPGCKKILKK